MRFESSIRKGPLGYSYIRNGKAGEATLIDYDTSKLDQYHWKEDKWYDCVIETNKDEQIKSIRRKE